MPRPLRVSVFAVLLPALLSTALALALAACRTAPELPVIAQIDELRLTTSLGGEMTAADLDGSLHVVDFIFTSCQMACPLMTAKMKALYDDLAEVDQVRFLSISTDPANDTVEVLHDYANRFGIDEDRWTFGRVDKEELVRLSEKEFLLGARNLPAGHSLKFVLVDHERRIRGYYDSEDAEQLTELRRALDSLLP